MDPDPKLTTFRYEHVLGRFHIAFDLNVQPGDANGDMLTGPTPEWKRLRTFPSGCGCQLPAEVKIIFGRLIVEAWIAGTKTIQELLVKMRG
ncbi:hypothetical protein QFC20_007702 [Naganishia adeliensis]|uniref:Uncharacterized protein n=1 Tax=Naganishia adeliensis TaxID=92952 RepID=A0ACC2UW60_9TREE|nr:hypothetical protein QFC20_007702 [Naganishia adeliensis]